MINITLNSFFSYLTNLYHYFYLLVFTSSMDVPSHVDTYIYLSYNTCDP